MNLNNDTVYLGLRHGPLHQLYPGRSRSLIRHHNSLHRLPLCFFTRNVSYVPSEKWSFIGAVFPSEKGIL
jgi:hypothetical protein